MAKPVYQEGELRRTRERLGDMSKNEADYMMRVLGGEVGDERAAEKKQPAAAQPKKPMRRVETIDTDAIEKDNQSSASPAWKAPSRPAFVERVKMAKNEAGSDFRIKTFMQSLKVCMNFVPQGKDPVNPHFILRRLDSYYTKLEKLVNAVRLIFPRNNSERTRKLKERSPFAFAVLNTIRRWKIEEILQSLTRLQGHARHINMRDLQSITADLYRPLFLLENIDPEKHIKESVTALSNLVMETDASEQHGKFDSREMIFWFQELNTLVRYSLYPVLLKLTSSVYYPYEDFFSECRPQILSFLGIQPDEIVLPKPAREPAALEELELLEEIPVAPQPQQSEKTPVDEKSADTSPIEKNLQGAESKISSPLPKAVKRGLEALEQLFPEAGWERLDMFPDIYLYFAKTLPLKKNSDIIAPENPVLQALTLLQILEELFYGFRAIKFTQQDDTLRESLEIIDGWHETLEAFFERYYSPRLSEYVKLFIVPPEQKTRLYAMKIREEIVWGTRLCLFPALKIDSISQVPIRKKDVKTIFPKVRTLRLGFMSVVEDIEKSLKEGGKNAGALCASIENPWDNYVFQVPNPLSKRLDLLLGANGKNNASLIFYTFCVLTVLDYFLSSEKSWAYETNTNKLFRSDDEDGIRPSALPSSNFVNTDAIFKNSLERLQQASKAKDNG